MTIGPIVIWLSAIYGTASGLSALLAHSQGKNPEILVAISGSNFAIMILVSIMMFVWQEKPVKADLSSTN